MSRPTKAQIRTRNIEIVTQYLLDITTYYESPFQVIVRFELGMKKVREDPTWIPNANIEVIYNAYNMLDQAAKIQLLAMYSELLPQHLADLAATNATP